MRAGRQRGAALALALLLAMPGSAAASEILYRLGDKPLTVSRYGAAAEFTRSLSQALEACGKPGLAVTGRLDEETRSGLARLSRCPGWHDITARHVDRPTWERLTATPPPDVGRRAMGVVLLHEGTDYDRVLWRFDRAGGAGLVWGPFNATVAHGNAIRTILRRVHQTAPDLFGHAFGAEAAKARAFIAAPAGRGLDLMRAVWRDPSRREAWTRALQTIGRDPAGRDAYDWYAVESPYWLGPNLKHLYSLIPAAEATETDYAFLLDLAVQTSYIEKKVAEARRALVQAGPVKGAERRRVIGRVFADMVAPRHRRDRLGRNVLYYVDSLGSHALSSEERSAWQWRGGYRAAQYGLSDDRPFVPAFLR